MESPLDDAEIAERLIALARELGTRAALPSETPSRLTRLLGRIASGSHGGLGASASDPRRARLGQLDVSELVSVVQRDLVGGESTSLEQGRAFGHVLSLALDRLLTIGASRGHGARQEETDATARRRSGSYFTPPRVAAHLVQSAFEQREVLRRIDEGAIRFCDPSVGGGAFLLESAYRVAERRFARGDSLDDAVRTATTGAHGVDVSELALATTRAALGLFAAVACRGAWAGEESAHGPTLRLGDSLTSDEPAAPFDLVVGNPPWVAFQGRAAQPLAPALRASYRARFSAFSGYPTLQGLFVERATELAPSGVIALLLPSSVADLLGYRNVRRAVRARHEVPEGLTEYGQDAFEGVVQPCFGLIAVPVEESREGAAPSRGSTQASARPFVLVERRRLGDRGAKVEPPEVLGRIAVLPSLPASCFGELGLQSNRTVSEELFLRVEAPRAPFVEPLLEGRNVAAFVLGPSRLFLHVDHEVLRRTRCSYRAIEQYQKVDFVIRQTAAWTIAARHDGRRFRNSLLAGYAAPDLDADLLVGLLNSSLYRALHVSRQRDARQGAFPQVKVSHLRTLPCPPKSDELRGAVSRASRVLTERGPSGERLAELERSVDALFSVTPDERARLDAFLAAQAR